MYSFIRDMGWVVGAVAGVGLEVRGQFRGADSVLCGVPGIKLGSSVLVASSFICEAILPALYHPHFRDKKTEAHRHNLLETFAKQWQHWL